MRWIPILLCLFLSLTIQAGNAPIEFDFFNGDFESARVKAGEEGQLFFVDFYATWCAPCKWMEETTFNDVEVKGLLKENYISVKVDIDDLDGYSIKEKYEIRILPTMLIFNSKGEMIARVEETLSPRKLAHLLSFHNTKDNKVRTKHTINTSPKEMKNTIQSYTPRKKVEKVNQVKPGNQKYRIQLGVFNQFENTYDMVNKLKSQFIEPVIVLNDQSEGKMLYKVMMGEFSTREEADDYRSILEKDFELRGIVK